MTKVFRFPSMLFHWSRTVTDRAKRFHYRAMVIHFPVKVSASHSLSAKQGASVMDLCQAPASAWDEDPGPLSGQAHVLLSA